MNVIDLHFGNNRLLVHWRCSSQCSRCQATLMLPGTAAPYKSRILQCTFEAARYDSDFVKNYSQTAFLSVGGQLCQWGWWRCEHKGNLPCNLPSNSDKLLIRTVVCRELSHREHERRPAHFATAHFSTTPPRWVEGFRSSMAL